MMAKPESMPSGSHMLATSSVKPLAWVYYSWLIGHIVALTKLNGLSENTTSFSDPLLTSPGNPLIHTNYP